MADKFQWRRCAGSFREESKQEKDYSKKGGGRIKENGGGVNFGYILSTLINVTVNNSNKLKIFFKCKCLIKIVTNYNLMIFWLSWPPSVLEAMFLS
jgi:hypothetical protein